VLISEYSIGKYWWLLMVIILMAIDGYSIRGYFGGGCWWLLMVIVLMTIGILMVINSYCI
jgi:hypothetical protein